MERVLAEWIPVWQANTPSFQVYIIDDGSTDQTPRDLERLKTRWPFITIHRQPNRGHGQACLRGYSLADASGANWIFQIDSDGQCDPRFFSALWADRHQSPVLYGYRHKREDGITRWWISRALSLAVWTATFQWVADPNVPYRLMRKDSLGPFLNLIPDNAGLVNVCLSVLQHRHFGIAWKNIVFRQRFQGESKTRFPALARQLAALWPDLRRMKASLPRSAPFSQSA